MFRFVLVFLCCSLSSHFIFAQNETKINTAGVYVEALGVSGTIRIGHKENLETDDKRVVISLVYIKEKGVDGTDVGQEGPPSQIHSTDSFVNHQFEFSSVFDVSFQNIPAKTFNLTSIVATGANLVLTIYLFTGDGFLVQNGENTTVTPGSVKFSIFIEKWKFCGVSVYCIKNQEQEAGRYLDLAMYIKGKADSPIRKTNGKRSTAEEYDLASGSVVISNQVRYDGSSLVSTPIGYPRIEQKDGKALFIFRFDRFTKSVLYDPQIDLYPILASTTTAPLSPSKSQVPQSPSSLPVPPQSVGTNVDNVHVEVLKTSGTIKIGNQANINSDPNRIEISFTEIREKTASGEDILESDHLFDNFAETNFELSDPEDITFMNLDARRLTLKSTQSSGFTFETEVFIFKENGNVTLEDEVTAIQRGNVKFNVIIYDWTFKGQSGDICNQSATGEYLYIGFDVYGRDMPVLMPFSDRTDGLEYELSTKSSVLMSKKVLFDNGGWVDMAPGYPKLENQTFYIRLRKFSTRAIYDPIVVYSYKNSGCAIHYFSFLLYVLMFTAFCSFTGLL